MITNDLTKEQAETRKDQIENIKYQITLYLNKTDLEYEGNTIINFNYKNTTNGTLRIDFITTNIKSLKVNGHLISNYKKYDYWIYIPVSELNIGPNNIQIDYINKYDNTGSGFHRFVDSEDNEVYIHSDFEPYDAHRLFPCFDQPDLKAKYKLTVTGPKDWQFIHNTEIQTESIDGNFKTMIFKNTELFSTYIFALVVGPHKVWEDSYNNIPLKIYCRKSLAKHLDPKNLFEMTKESFQFLENYFDIPYPYKKYDQIFVPEFNFGAMENVACVTFTEHYIFRSKQLYSEYLSRSNTIFHEMVHMWFGNLVTMKWWNDLWLNESFADYLSYYAMSKGKLFPDAFEFQFSRKEWAYMQDQLSTTHPIVGSAEDTADAFSNFDGISYAKGASVLKQLTYYIGEDKFRDGIRLYLKKFYENNTVLEDFLMCMSETSGIDIVEWSKNWLETTGVNTLKFNPDKDKCYIEQMPSETNHKIRDHAIMYETYDEKDGKISIVESNKIIISSAKTDVNISSSSKFTLLNAQDHDYVKIHFRDEELNFIYNNLKNINDRFTQRIIWGNLWQMVRDNALSAIWFLNLVEKYSDIEMDSTVLQEQMLQKTMSIKSIYLINEYRELWSNKLYNLAYKNLEKNQNDQFQISWFNLLLSCAESDTGLNDLKAILNGELVFDNLTIDQEKRWNIVSKLCAYGDSDYENLIITETENDPGDLGDKRAFMCRVSIPDLQMKNQYWEMFTQKKQNHSSKYLTYGMSGFFWYKQNELLSKYVEKFFDDIINIYKNKDVHYSSNFSHILFPSIMNVEEILNKTELFIDQNDDLPKLCKKSLIENKDHLIRRINILNSQKQTTADTDMEVLI